MSRLLAGIKLWWALRQRRIVRKAEQKRARDAYWSAQRKAWANDPLRQRQPQQRWRSV